MAIERLQIKRGMLDINKYICPECGQNSTKTSAWINHGMPIKPNILITPSLAYPFELDFNYKITLKDTPAIRTTLSKYQLFAFVLFDPKKHESMQLQLQKRHEQLDEDTGQSLLFFSYFQPNEDWLSKRKQSEPELADMWNIRQDDNPTLSIDLLAMQLQIFPEQLPCIVVTTSLFDATDYIVLPTTDVDVVRKLPKIADIADQLANDPYTRNQSSEFTIKMIEQQLTHTYGDAVRRRKLSDIQESLLSVIQQTANATPDDIVATIQSKVVALQKARTELNTLYKATDSDEFQVACLQIDETCDALFVWLQVSMPHLSQTYKINLPKLAIPKDALESNSAKYLDTYGRLVRVYTQIMQDSEDNTQIDYSPFAISLTKLFELEINLSIVQLIRYMNNIEMPAYYNRYQYGKTVMIDDINFNNRKYDSDGLKLPGIGQTYHVIKYIKSDICDRMYKILLHAEAGVSSPTWRRKFQKILDKWEKIIPMRNHVAHPDPVTLQEVKEIVVLLNDIGDSFTYLAVIKRKLRDDD
jgi:hypothetical protein